MVSTLVLKERRSEIRAKIEEQRQLRAEDDPFFKITDWLLAEWEQAERDAAREYVPTAIAAELTGWSAQTLRSKAQKARDGDHPGEGWEELQVRLDGSEWAFCVSTIPVKNTRAA